MKKYGLLLLLVGSALQLCVSDAFGVPWFCIHRNFNLTPGAEDTDIVSNLASSYCRDGLENGNPPAPSATSNEIMYFVDLAEYNYQKLGFTTYSLIAENETDFYHTTDPASLVALNTAGGVRLYWLPDSRFTNPRTGIMFPGYVLSGYIIETNVDGTGFAPLNDQPITACNLLDTTDYDNATVIYRIKSRFIYEGNENIDCLFSDPCVVNTASIVTQGFFVESVDRTELDTMYAYDDLNPNGTIAVALKIGTYPSGIPNTNILVQAKYNETWYTVPYNINSGKYIVNTTRGINKASGGIVFKAYLYNNDQVIQKIPKNTLDPEVYTYDDEVIASTTNNRSLVKSFPGYPVHPSSTNWGNFVLEKATEAQNLGYGAFWADNALANFRNWYVSTLPYDYEGDVGYSDAMQNLISDLRIAVSGAQLYINGKYNFYVDIDGGIQELRNSSTVPHDGNGEPWNIVVGEMWNALSHGRNVRIFSYGTDLMSGEDSDYFGVARIYDIATMLLAVPESGTPSVGNYALGYRPYQDLRFYPELTLDLGESITTKDYSIYYNAGYDPAVYVPEENLGIQFRRFQHGLVVLNPDPENITFNFNAMFPVGEMPSVLHQICMKVDTQHTCDDKINTQIQDGGVLETRSIDTAVPFTAEQENAYVFMFEETSSPVIEASCRDAVIADGVTPVKIVVENLSDSPLRELEIRDYPEPGTTDLIAASLELYDDGISGGHGDEIAGDDYYTIQAVLPATQSGNYTLRTWATGFDGLLSISDVSLRILPSILLKDASNGTGDLVNRVGFPYSANYFDAGEFVNGVWQPYKILSITAESGSSEAGRPYIHGETPNGTPVFGGDEIDIVDEPIREYHRALASGDYNRDGKLDLFVGSAQGGHRLYEKQSAGLVDVSGTKLAGPSFYEPYDVLNANWVDFDQDGWLDLLLTSIEMGGSLIKTYAPGPLATLDQRSVLYISKFGEYGWDARQPGCGYSFGNLWVDLDNDGDQDLVNSNIIGYWNIVFLNSVDTTGKYKLDDKTSEWLSGTGVLPLAAKGVTTLDYNHDGRMDLAYAKIGDENGALLLRNTGTSFAVDASANGAFEQYAGADFACSGIVAEDIDLNGWDDILLFPEEAVNANDTSKLKIYLNNEGTFVEVTAADLEPGVVSGAAIADYNSDGDGDFYFGTAEGKPFFFRNLPESYSQGDPPPENNWIGLNLEGSKFTTEHSAIGARVRIPFGAAGEYQTRVIDGGQGRTGQKPSTIIFGLGEQTGNVPQVLVTWPDGTTTTHTVDANGGSFTPGTIHRIVDPRTTFELPYNSLRFMYQPYPGGGADWIFTWTTTYRTDARNDRLEFDYQIPTFPSDPWYCGPSTILTWDDDDVEYTQFRENGVFKHRLVWKDRCCYASNSLLYKFRVYSGFSEPGPNDYSLFKAFVTKICLQELGN